MLWGGIQGNFVGAVETQRTEVIEAEHVVGVSVGVKDGVNFTDIFAQRLLAEIGGGVDKNYVPAEFDEHRWA